MVFLLMRRLLLNIFYRRFQELEKYSGGQKIPNSCIGSRGDYRYTKQSWPEPPRAGSLTLAFHCKQWLPQPVSLSSRVCLIASQGRGLNYTRQEPINILVQIESRNCLIELNRYGTRNVSCPLLTVAIRIFCDKSFQEKNKMVCFAISCWCASVKYVLQNTLQERNNQTIPWINVYSMIKIDPARSRRL